MIKEQIVADLKKALEELGIGEVEPGLEHPAQETHGDYATNVAMVVFRRQKTEDGRQKYENSLQLAKAVVNAYPKVGYLTKIEVAGPGFINFWLKTEFLGKQIEEVLRRGDDYGRSNILAGKKFLIEHTSPNTIKTLHLGHVRNNVLGMAVHNILEFAGVKVKLDAINNDRGIHVMKAVWAYLEYGKWDQRIALRKPRGRWEDLLDEWNKSSSRSLRVHDTEWRTPKNSKIKGDLFVDQFYILGVKAEERFKGAKEEMQNMLKAWEGENAKILAVWRNLRDWTFEGFLETYKKLESHHDHQWFESEFYKKGKELVLEGVKKGVFRRLSDGAVLSDLEKYSLPNVIILRADGTTMYHTQDLYLTKLKREKFPSNLYIWDIGPEQNLYLKQLFAMCEQLGIGKREDYFHLSYGYVYLKGKGKMSSRQGTVISADWLIDEVVKRTKEIIEKSETKRDLTGEKEKVANIVGVGAIKYSFLKISRTTDLHFDIEELLSLEGDSGPYLQYTYARCKSVITKWEMRDEKLDKEVGSEKTIKKSHFSFQNQASHFTHLTSEELAILRTIYKSPEVVETAAKTYSPNLICNFLFDLAQKYNLFYNRLPILKAESPELVKTRLALTAATAQIIKNGLNLLGIKVVERM